MSWKTVYQIVRETYEGWSEDNAASSGAALAYYTLFSIAPLLVIVIALCGIVFGPEAARGQIVKELQGNVGPTAAQAIEKMIVRTSNPGSGTVATVIGVVVLLIGAVGVFNELQADLNRVWKVQPKPGRGWLGVLKDRLLSFAMVLIIGLLLLVSMVASAALAALNQFLPPASLPGGEILWRLINDVVSFVIITLLFAAIYKILPDIQIAWRDVWVGAVVTALLFTVGKFLIGLYLGRAGVTSAYGAAGSLVLILLWVYYSSQLLLFGAEFTRVYAEHCGTRVVPADNAVFVGSANCAPSHGSASSERAAGPPSPHDAVHA